MQIYLLRQAGTDIYTADDAVRSNGTLQLANAVVRPDRLRENLMLNLRMAE